MLRFSNIFVCQSNDGKLSYAQMAQKKKEKEEREAAEKAALAAANANQEQNEVMKIVKDSAVSKKLHGRKCNLK